MSEQPPPDFFEDKTLTRKAERPPALDLEDSATFTGGVSQEERDAVDNARPNVRVSPPVEPSLVDLDITPSRSQSTTSSLDPYYFGIQADSPAPPLPSRSAHITPEMSPLIEPVTPARDPARIDRRGLVGVGELTTPRWGRATGESVVDENGEQVSEGEYNDILIPENTEEMDGPDSPWTIEAVDGEEDVREEDPAEEMDHQPELVELPRVLRSRPSVAEESGGEEILYPRKSLNQPRGLRLPQRIQTSALESLETEQTSPRSPPSAFTSPLRRAKKRTSDEFEIDQHGCLLPKREQQPSSAKARDKKDHRPKDISGSGAGNSPVVGKSNFSKGTERHARQSSGSSTTANHSDSAKRVHGSGFSHLPPSPSTSSIQHFLRHTGSSNSVKALRTPSRDAHHQGHASPNVAHSVLRGTQEGLTLDDDATVEALRKLDGLTGKTARARASVGSVGRPSSLSRPGTPPNKTSIQWEGVGNGGLSVRRGSGHSRAEAEGSRQAGLHLSSSEFPESSNELNGSAIASSDDQRGSSSVSEKTAKKFGSASARSSFVAKRSSASSTNYTGTPSSRDSASMSVTTNGTSMSAASGRHSTGKTRRNSGGSDASSVHSNDATSMKERTISHTGTADIPEEVEVPPVPPLPKDLSTYRSPPPSSTGTQFPSQNTSLDGPLIQASRESTQDNRGLSLEVPSPLSGPSSGTSPPSLGSISDSSPSITKTPSKKWSFSALSNKFSASPSSRSATFPASPRSVTFGQQLSKSTSKDHGALSPPAGKVWQPTHPDAMTSAASLASLSSVGSVSKSPTVQVSGVPFTAPPLPSQPVSSRPGTSSSINTNLTTGALSAPSAYSNPLSPPTSVKRAQSTKRLTPSSIPFFRRSSSQSMQIPPPIITTVPQSPSAGAKSSRHKSDGIPGKDNIPSTPSSSHKKSSMLSLGTLLKSSSRRSLHADKSDSRDSDSKKAREVEKEKAKADKERQKKEDKDRSESRISVLMGRKRGKTLSATDARKAVPVALPPMQMSAIPPGTAQRVASLKSNNTTPTGSVSTPRSNSSSSRLTSHTASSMQKQSDASLRNSRNQLPTIAGSPSVITGTPQQQQTNYNRVARESPSVSLMNSFSGLPKETPTKIPRISSRTSAASSPPPKNASSTQINNRASVNITGLPVPSSDSLSSTAQTDEFGVIESNVDNTTVLKTATRHGSLRSSPSTAHISTSRVPRQISNTVSTSGILTRKSNRESLSFGLRKSSTGSVASMASVVESETQSQQAQSHRFSALSPSKGLKLLTPKMSLPSTRSANSSISHLNYGASSSRQSLSTPSPVMTAVDDEELIGDDEMLHYIRRQQAKKMASGATQEELDELLCFPEPLPPGTPSSPDSILNSHQAGYLSDYERREILDYPSVYCIGSRSKKKLATVENSTNNHSYDDDRGDYLVVNHDHLAYRYEIIDTLGKGSFGQVLHCRDHCTGESVAIKIIRNKKRFHHQALVEIKILDNLRKWDSEEKHHVIKMTEHFYFRNHLCIAMELLSINLYELIKANGFVGFSTALIRRFTSQMLSSLSLMRHHRIVHCDLKPENVLLRHPAKSAIKVIDFGSSCFEHEKIYTYIQSRFYRSPEVILGMNYHMAIDMWSLGCIMAELYTGFPIFPGENEQEQLSCIMEILGVPEKDFINRSSRKKLFFDPSGTPRAVINSKGRRRRPGTKTLAQALRCTDEDFLDFIAKCLVWDPERRIKPQAAMRHPFISGGRRPKPSTPAKTLASGSRSKQQLNETPKKSQIGAPTPLTARSARTNGSALTASSSSSTLGSTSKSYRIPQSQNLTHYSSRTLSGIAASISK